MNRRTCGQGLAENSILPAKLGELTASVAEILELHTRALDLADENSRSEYTAYRELAKKHRNLAAQLQEIARQMAGYRDLPMGRHDPTAMSAPEAVEAFKTFVGLEQDLSALVETRLEQDRQMVAEMVGAVRAN
jgi:hypothetical protein